MPRERWIKRLRQTLEDLKSTAEAQRRRGVAVKIKKQIALGLPAFFSLRDRCAISAPLRWVFVSAAGRVADQYDKVIEQPYLPPGSRVTA